MESVIVTTSVTLPDLPPHLVLGSGQLVGIDTIDDDGLMEIGTAYGEALVRAAQAKRGSAASDRSPAASIVARKPRFTFLPDGRFIDNDRLYRAADGSLYRCEYSPTLNPEDSQDHASCMALASACKLDPSGGAWDAPEDFEIEALVCRKHSEPATPPELMKDTKPNRYWTKTPYQSVSSYAWGVYFDDGGVSFYGRDGGGFVRAVRRVPASQS